MSTVGSQWETLTWWHYNFLQQVKLKIKLYKGSLFAKWYKWDKTAWDKPLIILFVRMGGWQMILWIRETVFFWFLTSFLDSGTTKFSLQLLTPFLFSTSILDWIVCPQNLYIEALTPSIWLYFDIELQDIEVKWGPKGRALIQ